jgi:hypothetical protein
MADYDPSSIPVNDGVPERFRYKPDYGNFSCFLEKRTAEQMENGKNICFLILAHLPKETENLIRCLEHPSNYFFVHVDKKENIDDFEGIRHLRNVVLLTNEYEIFWGGISQVRATVLMLREAFASKDNFQRFCLLSGDSMPVKKLETIRHKLLDLGLEFIRFQPVNPNKHKLASRKEMEERNLIHPWRLLASVYLDSPLTSSRTDKLLLNSGELISRSGTAEIKQEVNRVIEKIFDMLDASSIKNSFIASTDIFLGSQWWALSRDAINCVLNFIENANNKPFWDYFGLTEAADEFFFHTILANAGLEKYKKAVGSYMFVDWHTPEKGRPAVLDESYFDRVTKLQGHVLFARKFRHDKSYNLVKKLGQVNA